MSAQADATGWYRIDDVPPSARGVTISVLASDSEGSAGVELCREIPGSGDVRADVRIAESYTAFGTVVAERGDPVDSATVRLEYCVPGTNTLPSPLAFSTRTTSDGVFTIKDVPAAVFASGPPLLCAKKPGLGASEIPLLPPRLGNEMRVTVRLAPFCRLRGTLKDTNGRPVESRTIGARRVVGRAFRERGARQFEAAIGLDALPSATTDARGQFEFTELTAEAANGHDGGPPDSHFELLWHPVLNVGVVLPPFPVTVVHAPAGKTTDVEVVVPSPVGRIGVDVIGPSGPVAGAVISVSRGAWRTSTVSDVAGQAGIPFYWGDGPVSLECSSQRWGYLSETDGEPRFCPSHTYELRYEGEPPIVSGVVVTAEKAPVIDAEVRTTDRRFGGLTTAVGGRFEFPVDRAGRFGLRVSRRSEPGRVVSFSDVETDVPATLEWPPGDASGGMIRVGVSGASRERVSIEVRSLDTGLRQTAVATVGDECTFSSLSSGEHVITVRLDGRMVSTQYVVVDQVPRDVLVRLEVGSPIEGVVSCRDASGQRSYRVRLTHDSGFREGTGIVLTTDPHGRIVESGVRAPAGVYRVGITSDDGEWVARGDPLVEIDGRSVATLAVEAVRACALSIRVTADGKRSVPSAVEVRRVGSGVVCRRILLSVVLARTEVRIDVEAGEYVVQAGQLSQVCTVGEQGATVELHLR